MFKIINLEIEEHAKEIIIPFIGFTVIIIHLILTIVRFTFKKRDKKYKKYYNRLFYDLIKYLFIEVFLILFETIESGKYNVSNSIGRIGAVHLGLIVFYAIKGPFKLK
jgi:hypothetical protein